jgi:hypothetical protein
MAFLERVRGAPSAAVALLDADEKGLNIVETLGGSQQMSTVSASR